MAIGGHSAVIHEFEVFERDGLALFVAHGLPSDCHEMRLASGFDAMDDAVAAGQFAALDVEQASIAQSVAIFTFGVSLAVIVDIEKHDIGRDCVQG